MPKIFELKAIRPCIVLQGACSFLLPSAGEGTKSLALRQSGRQQYILQKIGLSFVCMLGVLHGRLSMDGAESQTDPDRSEGVSD